MKIAIRFYIMVILTKSIIIIIKGLIIFNYGVILTFVTLTQINNLVELDLL